MGDARGGDRVTTLTRDDAGASAARTASYTYVRTDVSALVPASARRILDLGCSNGALGAHLKFLVPERAVTGVELDPAFAAEARTRLDAVVCGNLETLPIDEVLAPRGPFDCVICADVLEHLRDPWALLPRVVSLLARDGVLIVSLPNIRHHSALFAIFVRGRFPRRPRGIFDAAHLRWFTWGDAVDMLAGAGLATDATNHAVRIGDRGGGWVNRVADRVLGPVARLAPVREFFVYQFVLRARRSDAE
jgi:SAM-dependent methyltransferase